MSDLQVVGSNSIPASLDKAKAALAEATTDWERIDIRDKARAIAAASAILERKDIQVDAANLVQDAERAVAKANPPKSDGRPKKSVTVGDSFQKELPVTQTNLRNIRQAHNHVSDEEFEAKKAKAVETGIPLTRKELVEQGRENRKAEKRQEWEETQNELRSAPALDNVKLLHASCAELHQHVESDSVDIILTDPPYKPDTLSCYRDLAKFATYALKPGGVLLAMSGTSHLPQVMEYLCNTEGLNYHWMLNYMMPGGNLRFHTRAVRMGWKPVIWLVKGESDGTDRFDVVEAPILVAQDTRYHEWGQNEGGFKKLLDLFAFPGRLVCDPFLGGGTTAVVARAAGCAFIGADIDEQCIAITESRLEDE